MTEYINNWHKIWSNRNVVQNTDYSILQNLIILDGFDTPLGMMTEEQWLSYIALFRERCGIFPGDSIFEVGCGSGAFLYPFAEQGHRIGGLDYSNELVEHAHQALPEWQGSVFCQEAAAIDEQKPFDFSIANQVFHYFPDLNYASVVLDKMILKSQKAVYISGIPDIELNAESERERRGIMTIEDYEKKYAGLEILYFNKTFFTEFAKRYQLECSFYPHNMPGFAQNRFRFDCILKKHSA